MGKLFLIFALLHSKSNEVVLQNMMSHIDVLLYWLWTRFVNRNWRHLNISKSLLWLTNAQRQPGLVSIGRWRWFSRSNGHLSCWEHPMLVSTCSSPPGPRAGSTVVLREQLAAPGVSLSTCSQICWESRSIGASRYTRRAESCCRFLLLQKQVHWWSAVRHLDTELMRICKYRVLL